MKSILSFCGLLIVAAIALIVIKPQFTHGPAGSSSPQRLIDVVGVKTDLVSIGKAEQFYLAAHGTYASLEQLQQDGEITFSGTDRRGYNYAAEINDGQHFKITATPSAPDKQGGPTLSIDETLQVAQH